LLARLIEIFFPARQGERELTGVLFLHGLLAVGTTVAGRSVRDTLFLVHGSQEALAWMYVASAIAVSLAGLAYTPIALRLRRDRATVALALFFSILFSAAWWLERSGQPWVYATLYVFVEVAAGLSIMQFWMLVNELFNSREARRLYGVIGSGGTLANIVVGLATVKIATGLGASALLILCAVLSLGCAATAYYAGKLGQTRILSRAVSGQVATARPGRGMSRVLNSGHLRWVALLTVVTFFATTLVDFEFKVVAASSFSQDQLAAYFGYFYLIVGILAVALQILGAGKLINRLGVVGSLAILPISLGLGSFALCLIPSLGAATAAKGADSLFRYSINDGTTQILYLPVQPEARVSAKAFIDGVIKPFAMGLCGLALVGYRYWLGGNPYLLAWPTLVCCMVWVLIVSGLRSRYVESLEDSLRHRRLDFGLSGFKVQDGSTHEALTRVLQSEDPREVLHALELLPQLENVQLDDRVENLLGHSHREIRVAALQYFMRLQTMRFADSVYGMFKDPDASVRAAAIHAFCAMGRDKSVRVVRPFLTDPDPGVRGAAITGMIKYGGLDGVLAAAEGLKELIAHPDAAMRRHAAVVLGAIGVKNFYQPVLELMNDPDLSVRRQAIQSAGVLQSPEFSVPLIYKTNSIDVGREATTSLVAYGAGMVPILSKVLDNIQEDPAVRRGVARVLGRLGGVDAVEVILHHLNSSDEELKTQLYKALARATRRRRVSTVNRKQVKQALEREVERVYEVLAKAEALQLGSGPDARTPHDGPRAAEALLSSALEDKIAHIERRIFLLLAVLHSDTDMERIHIGIHDSRAADAARRRANALELLEHILPKNVKQRLLPLFDELPRTDRLRAATEFISVPAVSFGETVIALCKDDTAWVRACAVHYAAQLGCAEATDTVAAATDDPSPIVRESALLAAARMAPERIQQLAESRLGDDATVVRRQAIRMAKRKKTVA